MSDFIRSLRRLISAPVPCPILVWHPPIKRSGRVKSASNNQRALANWRGDDGGGGGFMGRLVDNREYREKGRQSFSLSYRCIDRHQRCRREPNQTIRWMRGEQQVFGNYQSSQRWRTLSVDIDMLRMEVETCALSVYLSIDNPPSPPPFPLFVSTIFVRSRFDNQLDAGLITRSLRSASLCLSHYGGIESNNLTACLPLDHPVSKLQSDLCTALSFEVSEPVLFHFVIPFQNLFE